MKFTNEQCHNCFKKIRPRDEDAGTYKEYFCSKACEIEAEEAMQNFENGLEIVQENPELIDAA